jgi:transcriptional regulator GlxA family with amidase domain
MLQETQLLIGEVARRIGRERYAGFSRAYGSNSGHSPSVEKRQLNQ